MRHLAEKILHLGQRTIVMVKEYPKNRKEFNRPVANVMAWNYLIPTGRSPKFIQTIYEYIEQEIKPIWEKYKTAKNECERPRGKIPVWICWFQGEQSMPELVRVCYQSVRRNVPEFAEVRLVTLDNISHYVGIPSVITEKFNQGIISFALYSDVLRYYLLRDYGGMWIDATIFVSAPIPKEWFEADYYTMRMPKEMCVQEPCEGKWTNFCFAGGKNNLIFSFVCETLLFFFGKKNHIPDYIFLDYILMAGYHNIPSMKQQIDSVPLNNKKIWALKNNLSNRFDKYIYQEITENNVFHKLAHQVEYPKITTEGTLTFYGFICKQGGIT